MATSPLKKELDISLLTKAQASSLLYLMAEFANSSRPVEHHKSYGANIALRTYSSTEPVPVALEITYDRKSGLRISECEAEANRFFLYTLNKHGLTPEQLFDADIPDPDKHLHTETTHGFIKFSLPLVHCDKNDPKNIKQAEAKDRLKAIETKAGQSLENIVNPGRYVAKSIAGAFNKISSSLGKSVNNAIKEAIPTIPWAIERGALEPSAQACWRRAACFSSSAPTKNTMMANLLKPRRVSGGTFPEWSFPALKK